MESTVDNQSPTSINPDDYYREAFSRNLFDEETQAKIRNSTVAIAGLGAVGGMYAVAFARLGVENFHLSDFDTFDVVNINRQLVARTNTFGKPKLEATKEEILSINPHAKVETFSGGLSENNIEAFLDGVDVVLDGIDFFNIDIRRLVFRAAYENNIVTIGAAPVGYGSSLMSVDPGGMSFDQYFDLSDDLSESEMLLRFGIGLAPAALHRSYFKPGAVQFKQKKAKSLMTGVLMCGNLVTTEFIKLITDKPVQYLPKTSQFDPMLQKYKKVSLPFGNKHPLQKVKLAVARKQFKKLGFFD